jgi:hypothetical protein
MLKSTIGSALLVYSPTRKAQEEWCTDLAKALHSSILHNKSKIDKLEESNQALKKKIACYGSTKTNQPANCYKCTANFFLG